MTTETLVRPEADPEVATTAETPEAETSDAEDGTGEEEEAEEE